MSSRPCLVAAFSLGLALVSAGAARSAHAGPPGPREQAAWDFEAGKRHMASGKLDKALEELSSAHGVLKTVQTALAYAQVLEKKGDLAKAREIVAEGLAMPKVKNEAFKVTQARKELETLSTKLGAAETKPAETKPAETKPSDTKPADTKPTDTKPTDTKPADAKPEESKPADPPAPTKPIVKKESGEAGGGATVAALVGWSGFAFGASFGLGAFFSSKKTFDELDPVCPNGECPTFFRNKYEDAKSLQTMSFVGFGIGGAGLITGIVGAAVAGAQRSGGKESAAAAPALQLAIGPSSVEVSGSF